MIIHSERGATVVAQLLEKAARNAQIEKLRVGGSSVSALALEFGVSQSRVRQILVKREINWRRIKVRLEAPLR
jgi:hypothetical protein